MYVDFNTGIAKYDGLVEDAVKMGFLQQVRGGYICPTWSDKRVTYRDLISKSEIWDTFIGAFNDKSKKTMEYSSSALEELNEILAEDEARANAEEK